MPMRFARKHNHRHATAKPRDDLLEPAARAFHIVAFAEHSTQAVENLHGIGPRLDLQFEKARHSIAQFLKKAPKKFWILVKQRPRFLVRSEEHTSELQSPYDLVCRLLL